MSEIKIAAGTATPALGPFFAPVLPAARGNWEVFDVARGVDPGLVAPFDFEADGATDADFVGVTEACVVGCALVECRGVDDGVLDGAG